MENFILVAILIILVVGNGVTLFILSKKFKDSDKENNEDGIKHILTQLHEFNRTVDQKMSDGNKMMNESVRAQFGESAKLIKEVTEGLTKLDETNKQVVSFADQLQNLQDILKNPKQRGVLGEYYLETVLKNVLAPGMYQMQYGFKNGEIVDAVVFVGERIIPIDSKFSLENYNRTLEARDKEERERYERAFKSDLKLRIDETSKYVRPEDGTMEFAFMFIPSEGIYYDILINQVGAIKTNTRDLIEYAFAKKVIIVSPTSFLAYLQTVLQGLKAMRIEKDAEEIKKRVGELGRHLLAYEDYYTKLGNALSTTVNHYNAGYKELGKVDKDVLRITGEKMGFEPLTLDKPRVE